MQRILSAVFVTLVSGTVAAADTPAAVFSASDYRNPIPVTARERNQVLFEMREFLHGMHNIHHALARNDMKAVALEARPMGQMIDRIPAELRERVPEAFLQMGIALHEAFNQLARIAEGNGSVSAAQEQMAEIVTYCSGCHDTYRMEVVSKPPKR
jgi:cytochrome c556